MWRVLVVEDDLAFRAALEREVGSSLADRAEIVVVGDIDTARKNIAEAPPDLIILDAALPMVPGGRPDPRAGVKLLAELPRLSPGSRVTVLSGQDRRAAVEILLTRRIDGYLFKDGGFDEVRLHLEKALDDLDLRRSHRLLKEGVDRGAPIGMVAEGPRMRELTTRARQVAVRDTSVLITGESGTGKEVLARFVHGCSSRSGGPFVALSCGALAEGLAEAELFGAVKGAYTGLDRDREGVMAQARGGTLFLDEIGELPLSLQPKFLRALQERTFKPLGASREEKADFRLVCATHRDLRAAADKGTFREDLLFRIAVFPLHLPPLRERLDELPALVAHLLARFNREMGRKVSGVAPETLELLSAHTWPGNVRELSNTIEYAFVVETSETITPSSLPMLPRRISLDGPSGIVSHAQAMNAFERTFLERALASAGYHIGRTSEMIGLPRRTLQDRMAKQGIRIREETGG